MQDVAPLYAPNDPGLVPEESIAALKIAMRHCELEQLESKTVEDTGADVYLLYILSN